MYNFTMFHHLVHTMLYYFHYSLFNY